MAIFSPAPTSSGLAIQTVNVDRVRIHVLRMSDKLVPASKGVIGEVFSIAAAMRSKTAAFRCTGCANS